MHRESMDACVRMSTALEMDACVRLCSSDRISFGLQPYQVPSLPHHSRRGHGRRIHQTRASHHTRTVSRAERTEASSSSSVADNHGSSTGTQPDISSSRAPLVDALAASASRHPIAPFHFPGHRRGAAAPRSLVQLLGSPVFVHDLPELPELDSLFCPQDAILQAQRKAADTFGAEDTFFLINGSTSGIQAAIMATCSPGKTLILPRNCHISAVSGMVLCGAVPKYVMPKYDAEWDIAHGIDPADVERALLEVQEQQGKGTVGAVLITSPTYYGVCSNIRQVSHICHCWGVPLIVDEAHGAHFRFHKRFPETALDQGADIVVQSTHKVLSSLTQSAMLHLQGDRINKVFLSKCLQTLQSSSPSYLLLASLDAAREHVSQSEGMGGCFEHALHLAGVARDALQQIPGIVVLDLNTIRMHGFNMDPLRITVGLQYVGISGFEADVILCNKHHVVAELPSLRSITFAISSGTTSQDVESLISALQSISKVQISSSIMPLASVFSEAPRGKTECDLSPRQAFFSATQRVAAEAACGKVCAELICPYPPGIPLVVPGEVITSETLSYLKTVVQQGGMITGASDSSLNSLLS